MTGQVILFAYIKMLLTRLTIILSATTLALMIVERRVLAASAFGRVVQRMILSIIPKYMAIRFIVRVVWSLLSGRKTATFAGNAYWSVDGKYKFAGYRSLEDWRAATGQEMLNGKPVGMVVDPKLIDIGNNVTIGDPTKLHTLTAYQLQKDSPMIDAGINLRAMFGIDLGNRDFFGNPIPQGKGFDIGAHEITLENTPK